jgi:AcrR family transcriptional regulator
MRATSTNKTNGPVATRPGLSTNLIVDAACELIAESHADELTMRKLSDRLGVALGATYHYVPNRDTLLTLVADRIMSGVSLRSTRSSGWQDALRALMIDYAGAFAKYPGMAAFTLANLQSTGRSELRDDILRMLAGAGFSRRSGTAVLGAFFFLTNGVTATEFLARDQPGFPSRLMAKQFEEALEVLIKGAAAQLRADKRRTTS